MKGNGRTRFGSIDRSKGSQRLEGLTVSSITSSRLVINDVLQPFAHLPSYTNDIDVSICGPSERWTLDLSTATLAHSGPRLDGSHPHYLKGDTDGPWTFFESTFGSFAGRHTTLPIASLPEYRQESNQSEDQHLLRRAANRLSAGVTGEPPSGSASAPPSAVIPLSWAPSAS